MKPTIQLAKACTPDGHELVLSRHDRDFYLSLDQSPLMNSREYESELELARLGCHGLGERHSPRVLIGGLGMGFTLKQTLALLPEKAKVVVAELIPEVVVWNRDLLGELTGHPLRDRRVVVKTGSVTDVIRTSKSVFDAILLDVDNGPSAMTIASNAELYGPDGLHVALQALKEEGRLAIWSVNGDVRFERLLKRGKIPYRVVPVPAFKNARTRSRCIWLIAQNKDAFASQSYL